MTSANPLSHVKISILPTVVRHYILRCSIIAFDSQNPAYLWRSTALILIALVCANQAFFFWGQLETVHGFEAVTVALLAPLTLGAWTMAWRLWFRVRDAAWICVTIVVLTLVYMVSQFLSCSWFYGVFSHSVGAGIDFISASVRLLFVSLWLLIIYRGIRQRGRDAWYALAALVLVSIGLFVQELSVLHIPGIWFPFGTGVSRTQFAYAAFDVAMFALLLRRLLFFVKREKADRETEIAIVGKMETAETNPGSVCL